MPDRVFLWLNRAKIEVFHIKHCFSTYTNISFVLKTQYIFILQINIFGEQSKIISNIFLLYSIINFSKIRATSRQTKERDTATGIFKYLNKPADKIL